MSGDIAFLVWHVLRAAIRYVKRMLAATVSVVGGWFRLFFSTYVISWGFLAIQCKFCGNIRNMSGDIPSLICNVNYKSPCICISLDASWWDKTRWFANHFSDLFELELMLQNDFCKNRPLTFHDHWSLEAKPLTRPKNGWNYVEKESKRLWNVFCTFPGFLVPEVRTGLAKKCRNR